MKRLLILLVVSAPPPAAAQCLLSMRCVAASRASAPPKNYPDRASCESAANYGNASYPGCTYSCSCSGSGPGSAAAGPLDPQAMTNAIMNLPADEAMQVMTLGLMGAVLQGAMSGPSPAERARRRAEEAEAARLRELEAERLRRAELERRRRFEEDKRGMLGQMRGTGPSTELQPRGAPGAFELGLKDLSRKDCPVSPEGDLEVSGTRSHADDWAPTPDAPEGVLCSDSLGLCTTPAPQCASWKTFGARAVKPAPKAASPTASTGGGALGFKDLSRPPAPKPAPDPAATARQLKDITAELAAPDPKLEAGIARVMDDFNGHAVPVSLKGDWSANRSLRIDEPPAPVVVQKGPLARLAEDVKASYEWKKQRLEVALGKADYILGGGQSIKDRAKAILGEAQDEGLGRIVGGNLVTAHRKTQAAAAPALDQIAALPELPRVAIFGGAAEGQERADEAFGRPAQSFQALHDDLSSKAPITPFP